MEERDALGQLVAPGPEAPSPLPIVYTRRIIRFNEEGLPVPVNVPQISKRGLSELAATALSLLYTAPKDNATEEELDWVRQGMTNAEVMMIRTARRAADGDQEATELLLDRAIGKPKQSSESLTVSVSYADFLKRVADGAIQAEEV